MGFDDRDYYRDQVKRKSVPGGSFGTRVRLPFWRRHLVPLVAAVAVLVGYCLRWILVR